MRRSTLFTTVLLGSLLSASPCFALTQRGINTLAASLLRTHRGLIEEPGLRHPEEPLPAYFQRLLARQPGEKEAQRKARIAVYFRLLTSAVTDTANARQIPALHDTSAANHELWKQATLNLSDLVSYLNKAQLDWKREENAANPQETGKSVAQFVWHLQNAYAALRDVRP